MNMKKQILSLILTAAMLCAISFTAAAVKPNPDESVSLTIHQYRMKDGKLWTDLEQGNGREVDNIDPEEYAPFPGVTYTLTLMKLKAGDNVDPSDMKNYEEDWAEGWTEVTDAKGEILYNDAAYKEFVQDPDAVLPQGVYKVQQTPEDTITTQPETNGVYYVRLPMTDPVNNADWIYDVHLYPKNKVIDDTDFDKKVLSDDKKEELEEKNVEDGETVTWRLKSIIPARIATAREYKFTDTFDKERLQYVEKTIKVYYLNKAEERQELTEEAGDYEVEWLDSNSFTVSFTKEGMIKLSEAETFDNRVHLEFDTIVLINTEGDVGVEIPNDGDLDYTNEFGEDFNWRKRARVYTGGLRITKVDGSSYVEESNTYTTPLEDVEFRMYRMKGQDKEYYGGTVSADNKKIIWTTVKDSAKVLKTDENGIIQILGLRNGIYYLEEIATLQGYMLLEDDIEMEVTVTKLREDEGTSIYQYGMVSKPVANYKGFRLPFTGGTGGLWMSALGAMLLILGFALYQISKRKRHNKGHRPRKDKGYISI